MIVGLLALAGLPLLLAAAAVEKCVEGAEAVVERRRRSKEREIARVDVEIDAKQEELRATVLRLATLMSGEAHEARRAMIRASYEAAGQRPDTQ